MKNIFYLVRDAINQMLRGSLNYYLWVGLLLSLIFIGGGFYYYQLSEGLIVTNMTNQVSWGFYIANFTFLVGVAAAAVMLVIPAYVFHRDDIKNVVLMGDFMAIGAVIMALLFVLVDMGRLDRAWHLIPGLGRFNFPSSMLAWDVIVLNGYLLLNVGISFYIIFCHYMGCKPKLKHYFPFVILAIFWAISIHTVTAFLYSASTGRAFWHNALLAPRFIASAFCSGPALMLLGMQIIRSVSNYPIRQTVINHLAIVMTIALQITLFFTLAELFTDFYNEGEHAASARYLFFGLNGHAALTPWIWTSVVMLVIAMIIGMIHSLRNNLTLLNIAAVLAAVGIWIEKGMGFVIPGFIPTPIGEIYEYTPNLTEVMVSMGIWAIGLLIFTLLAKAAIPIECGDLRAPGTEADEPICEINTQTKEVTNP